MRTASHSNQHYFIYKLDMHSNSNSSPYGILLTKKWHNTEAIVVLSFNDEVHFKQTNELRTPVFVT
jgi:hypothetical protein